MVPEALRGRWPLGGLPWGELGAALHDVPVARALAGVGGVPLVSFVVVVTNALLLDLAYAVRAGAMPRLAARRWPLGGVVLACVVVDATRFEPEPTGELRVALLQGNDQNRDIPVASAEFVPITENHFELAESLEGNYDLIVFPESALYADPEADAILGDRVRELGAAHDAAVLVNAAVDQADDDRALNVNYLYAPDGALARVVCEAQPRAVRRVPPRAGCSTGCTSTSRSTATTNPVTLGSSSRSPATGSGTMICFESAFASVSRAYARDGAELLVLTTNNRSYRRSGNSEQHVALSQMRAAETGRPVLHASISGVSAIIDAGGRVDDRTELFRNAVLTASVTTTTGRTIYVRFGEWVVLACGLALILTALVAQLRSRKRTVP